MTIDRWNRIEEIFQGALERPSSERSAYVAQACGDDKELLSEIELLLANDRGGDTTLRSLVEADVQKLAQASSPSEAGLQIGPYRLVRELDSGGMGVVYLAVRSDDQYFQIVAIKMIRKGLEWPSLVQRFRAERQILATLTHPHIGAILDGGEAKDGRPFIVMEYVEGQPITLACESGGLSIRQRVELFRSVCSAVHYAHQKLVIHRDIKPSNVLVTPQGNVKLIDFGVSKPLAPELIPGELPKTESWQRLLTPDYASPEQLQGKELTTASDIYSLGVLLFELLTGSRPYSLGELSPAAAERLVCEQGIPKPSAVPELPDRVRKEVAGDLDRIVCKAMNQDPSRRYLSAQHLEEDLLRFLEGRPVLARDPTPLYRLNKFLKRHRTASLMACATLMVLVGSVFFHGWQSRLADRKVKQVATLADSAISDLTSKLEQAPASTETQAALFHSALGYLEQLRQSSGNDPRVLLELSKVYMRVGDLEGSPFVANLGNTGSALNSYQEALHAATEAHSRLPGEESTRTLIEAYQRLARMEYSYASLENLDKAADHYQHCLPLARGFWQLNPADPVRIRLLASSYSGLADIEDYSLQPDKALENYRKALQIVGGELSGNEDHDMMLPRLYTLIGLKLYDLGLQTEAFANLRKAVTIAEALAQRSPSPKQAKRRLYTIYDAMIGPLAGDEMLNVGDSNQAQAYARKALTLAEELAASDSKNAQASWDLGFAYFDMGNALRLTQRATAAAWYRKSISFTQNLTPRSEAEIHLAFREESLAAVLVKKEQAVERLHLLLEVNALRQKVASTEPDLPMHRQNMMRSYCRLSDAELAVNDLATARRYADLSVRFLNTFPLTSPDLRILRDVGLCYESLGNLQRQIAMDQSFSAGERRAAELEARQWYLKSSEVWHEWDQRGASTPESQAERRKIEHLLRTTRVVKSRDNDDHGSGSQADNTHMIGMIALPRY